MWRETGGSRLCRFRYLHFNPLPPCGGRPDDRLIVFYNFVFQSTPSVWRETTDKMFAAPPTSISIHSLRVEGDRQIVKVLRYHDGFQSTPSVWRETTGGKNMTLTRLISIHSLRVEGDSFPVLTLPDVRYFNPLPPCGGRHYEVLLNMYHARFQSTPSVWRETGSIW